MPVGATIGLGVASVGSAAIGASAAKKAAKTQATAANNVADMNLGMFNTIRDDLSPYRTMGAMALPGLAQLMGFTTAAGQPTTLIAPQAYAGGVYGGLTGAGGVGGAPGAAATGGGANYAAYVQNNPDLLAAYQANPAAWGSPMSMEQWGQQHWQNNGAGEQRAFTPTTGASGVGTNTFGGLLGATPDYEDYVRNNPDLLSAFQSHPDLWGQSMSMADWGKTHWDKYADQNKERTYTPFSKSNAYLEANPDAKAAAAAASGMNPGATMQAYLESTPGYQFTKQQGMQAVENTLNARGLGGLSGSLGKGLARFVTGLADQTYGKAYDRLTGVAAMGQNAANQTGAFGTQATQAAGSAITGGANATAAGQVGVANAVSGGLQGVANAGLSSRLLGMYGGGGGAAVAPTNYGQGGVGWTPLMGG